MKMSTFPPGAQPSSPRRERSARSTTSDQPDGGRRIEHGGDPQAMESRFGAPEDGWLDLSTGINPLPYPLDGMASESFQRLPTRADMDGLLQAARTGYQIPDGAGLVAAPGTQSLIQLVPRLLAPGDVTVMQPTYGEHAPAWAAAGHNVVAVGSICAQAAQPAPYAVLVHPNNPDGRTQSVDGLLALADELHARGGVLVVDEAFADVTPELSVTPHAGRAGLIVLRSFGKFFGLAGVRLGFAVCAPDMAGRLNAQLGPWAVPGPAIWAGTQALRDGEWIAGMRNVLKLDALRLDGMLADAGLDVIGGTDLFRLVEGDAAQAVFEHLGREGIAVRAFSERPTWLRFGLPGRESDWKRLAGALKRWRQSA